MPLNIESAESAFLGGFARFEDWKERFEGKWFAPVGEMQVALLMKSLPDAVKAELRARVPEGMAALEEGVLTTKGRRKMEEDETEGRGYRFGGADVVDEGVMS